MEMGQLGLHRGTDRGEDIENNVLQMTLPESNRAEIQIQDI